MMKKPTYQQALRQIVSTTSKFTLGHLNGIIETNLVPDVILRNGIRAMLAGRLASLPLNDQEKLQEHIQTFVEGLRRSPVAINTADANKQHYEVPTEYYNLVLGKRKKYSSCYYPEGVDNLNDAEDAAFRLVVERAEIEDGMAVVDLGCGWGSLTLYLLETFPNLKVTSVSNSRTQKIFIESVAKEKGWAERLTVLTMDANKLHLPTLTFDRVLSIEMFEHMKNYALLLSRVSRALKPSGKLFVHIFTHKSCPYHFEDKDDSDWMTRYFFSGGTMPYPGLLHHFNDNLRVERQWAMNGTHYAKTCEDWLKNQDKNEALVRKVFEQAYGPGEATKWIVRWRLFYLACAECFAYNGGNEWFVTHYLFSKKQ